MKFKIKLLMVFCLLVLPVSMAYAAVEDRVLKAWTRTEERNDGIGGQAISVRITYYSAEYIAALVRSEAEKNMWTKDEEERYKYNLLKTLDLDNRIAFHFDINVTGIPVYMQPFDRHLKLYVGKKDLAPVDYDKRFNFKLSGQRDGMVWFPRYDEKTGKNLLDGVKDLRLVLNGSINQATTKAGDVRFIWNIAGDDPSVLNQGTAAARLELDRLIKRVEKLRADRKKLQTEIDAIDKELHEVDVRVEELQKQ